MTIRPWVPYDPRYTALAGAAVYVFAYSERAVIYLIQQFKPGFMGRCCRGAPMTSGVVKRDLEAIVADPQTTYPAVAKTELKACVQEFARLIDKRNALIHVLDAVHVER